MAENQLTPQGVSEGVSDVQRREDFGELAMRFEAAAFRWAYSILGDTHLAQDAVQEAYLIAFLHIDQLREPQAFAAWFRQIVFTACTRLIRRRDIVTKLREQAVQAADENSPDPSEVVEEHEDKASVHQAVQTLPEHERIVADMFYFSDYSQEEIARVLAVPVTTVKKRLQHARERLRRRLEQSTSPSMLLAGYPELLGQADPNELSAEWLVDMPEGTWVLPTGAHELLYPVIEAVLPNAY
jgi:RNA polymerase sigma factor (sigma-70 family)